VPEEDLINGLSACNAAVLITSCLLAKITGKESEVQEIESLLSQSLLNHGSVGSQTD